MGLGGRFSVKAVGWAGEALSWARAVVTWLKEALTGAGKAVSQSIIRALQFNDVL